MDERIKVIEKQKDHVILQVELSIEKLLQDSKVRQVINESGEKELFETAGELMEATGDNLKIRIAPESSQKMTKIAFWIEWSDCSHCVEKLINSK